tara:strand:+ start:1115 stop:1990 length:876 start_codon:yes stop_codon:yes gene_type:complete
MTQIPVRVAGAQIPVTQSIKDNVITIKKAIDYAVENRCDYLVTPEGALSGYDHGNMMQARQGQYLETDVYASLFDSGELTSALTEVERYANDKVGLCLGTLWKEKERFGEAQRNQIRFYDKKSMLIGTTSKTYGIVPQDVPFLEHDMEKSGVPCWQLGDDTFKFNVVGLICNDMWGHGWSGGQMIPWAAKQNFNSNGRNDLQLFVHATNGFRDNDTAELFNNWHHSHLTMMSYITEVPIISVDNSIHMNGDDYNGTTSSESGVYIKGQVMTKVPRTGTQYFYYDFFGESYE